MQQSDVKDFKVPFGKLDTGVLVRPSAASKDTSYFCPGCDSQLIFRSGPQVAPHFAHKAEGNCTGESLLHKTAKALLVQTVRNHVVHPTISLRCSCRTCQKPFSKALPRNAFTDALEEIAVGSRICDVVTFRDVNPALAIEVFATHSVDQVKAMDLTLPWIELLAEDVINEPSAWKPVQAHLKPQACPACKDLHRQLHDLQTKFGLEVHPPAKYAQAPYPSYLAAQDTCFSCKQPMPVYWWRGVPFCQQAPPNPRPRTVQFKFSKQYGGKYWMNTCAACGAPSGDNFLFLQPGAPMRHLPLNEPQEAKILKQQNSAVVQSFLRHI